MRICEAGAAIALQLVMATDWIGCHVAVLVVLRLGREKKRREKRGGEEKRGGQERGEEGRRGEERKGGG